MTHGIQDPKALKSTIHIEVSDASKRAIAAVEALGGTVTCAHFNKLALRALVKPYKFLIYPNRARPPPKLMGKYLDRTKSGYLSPEIQIRNLKLFGTVTSEKRCREEHELFLKFKRSQWQQQKLIMMQKAAEKVKQTNGESSSSRSSSVAQ